MPEPEILTFKDVVFYIPRKIKEFFTVYKELLDTTSKQAGTIRAYKARMKKIQFYAEINMCDKVKELATTPIDCKF